MVHIYILTFGLLIEKLYDIDISKLYCIQLMYDFIYHLFSNVSAIITNIILNKIRKYVILEKVN